MQIHNSCTRNGDNHSLLIKTANAYKQRSLPQTTIYTCKEYRGGIETQSEMIVRVKGWLLSQLQK